MKVPGGGTLVKYMDHFKSRKGFLCFSGCFTSSSWNQKVEHGALLHVLQNVLGLLLLKLS